MVSLRNCPICDEENNSHEVYPDNRDGYFIDCPNCGQYLISGTAHSVTTELSLEARAVVSHGIWRNQGGSRPFEVCTSHLKAAEDRKLPMAAEKLDLLLLHIGDAQGPCLCDDYTEKSVNLRAKIGAMKEGDVAYVAKEAEDQGLLHSSGTMCTSGGRLTMAGWERYDELKRGHVHSRTAFMAMPFKPKDVGGVVDEVFRPAVKECGFELRRADDNPQAGVIDNLIRVEITRSKFVIADLTGENPGAYWEAGYAEGQGKHVIYTCEQGAFEAEKTHFDTNHCTTVPWSLREPEKAARALVATIRATFPFEALMPPDN